MKSIQSAGGPFIMLEHALAPRWGGVAAKTFMSVPHDAENDYESLCALLDQPENERKGLVALRVDNSKIVFLTMPMVTSVRYNNPIQAFIMQIHYADPSWSAEMVSETFLTEFFRIRHFVEEYYFCDKNIVIFDSGNKFKDVGDDYLMVELSAGLLQIKHSLCAWDERTLISATELKIQR